MKIKSDFVTNSSSSSFIVAWPNEIKTLEDVKKYIDRDDKAKQVYEDTKNAKTGIKIDPENRIVINTIASELESGYLQNIVQSLGINVTMFDQFSEFKKDFIYRHNIEEEDLNKNHFYSTLVWKEYGYVRMKIATKLAKEFCKKNKDNFVYFFNYGDESGDFMSEMEHGNTFKNLPHIQVSHH
jgi:hypothetical protein